MHTIGCGGSPRAPSTEQTIPGPSAPAQQTAPALDAFRRTVEETAAELLRDGGSFIARPVLRIDADQHRIVYGPGEMNDIALGLTDNGRFSLAVAVHLRAHMLTELLEPLGANATFWRPAVDELNGIADELARGASDASFQSWTWEARIQDVMARFENEAETYARSMQYDFVVDREGGRLPASTGFSVEVTTAPPLGTIRMLGYLAYRKEQLQRTSHEAMPWITLAGARAQLIGRYRYWVTWPNGASAEGIVEVNSSQPLNFVPRP